MTIAEHCLRLLSERSPRTPEDLAASCRAAGVTRSRTPVAAVKHVLTSHGDEAPALPDGSYAFSLHLLDGRWFTTRRHDADRLSPSFDLRLLQRLVAGRSVPCASGGAVAASPSGDGMTGPPGWLPAAGELVGVRLRQQGVEVRPVRLDDEAGARGADLAARLRVRVAGRRSWWPASGTGHEHEVWAEVLQLLAEDAGTLREPVPPLSELLADMAHRPEAFVRLGRPMAVRLPELLQEQLASQAARESTPLDRWLTDRLEELALDPWRGRRPYVDDRWGEYALYDDPTDGGWDDVVRLRR